MSERLRRLCSISVSKAKTRKLDPQRSGGDILDPALSHTILLSDSTGVHVFAKMHPVQPTLDRRRWLTIVLSSRSVGAGVQSQEDDPGRRSQGVRGAGSPRRTSASDEQEPETYDRLHLCGGRRTSRGHGVAAGRGR